MLVTKKVWCNPWVTYGPQIHPEQFNSDHEDSSLKSNGIDYDDNAKLLRQKHVLTKQTTYHNDMNYVHCLKKTDFFYKKYFSLLLIRLR